MRNLIAPLATLIALLLLVGCSTSEALVPPGEIGGSSAAAVAPVQSLPDNSFPQQTVQQEETQFPQAPQQQDQQLANSSPALGSPGGISATQRSIFQQQASAPITGGSIRFLPVIGAPVSAVTPLSQQLATAARSRGLTLKGSADQSADHMLKGYFSAFADGGQTKITYVWDILDGAGTRLHRIQGQENVPGTSGDNWSNVPDTTMQKIANDTIAGYANWRTSATQ